ncbi:MAG: alpha/beta hydrolase [Flavobacteriaceae bacterium]
MRYFTYFLVIVFFFSCNTKQKESILKKAPLDGVHQNLTNFKTITFPSKDGLKITADLYQVKKQKGFFLLCHQAGFSRGEYVETAKKLNKLGYSAMAIDQRSGKEVKHIINETAKRAAAKKLSNSYLDAKPDVISAIDYAYKLNDKQPIFLVGSSYSASLVLWLATKNSKIKAVAAFSPGEYLKGIDLAKSITDLNIPVFATSSKKEIKQVEDVLKNVISKQQTHFKPKAISIHGSRALWEGNSGNKACWDAFSKFIMSLE